MSAEPGALRAAWPDLPLSRQQAILRAVARRVVVKPYEGGPRNVFDGNRVIVDWKA